MPRGRPKKQIDLEAVRELASEGNTQEEIARALGACDLCESQGCDRSIL